MLCRNLGLLITSLPSYSEFHIGYFKYMFLFFEPESHIFLVDGIYRYALSEALKEITKVAK